MGKYILKRILIAIPVLIGITVIDYTIMCLAGSPLEMLQGPRVSEAAVEAKRIALRQPYRPYAALDGRVPSGEPAAGGSGGNLQCDPAVFQRGLCGGDGFLSWQQRAGVLPVASADLSFYGEAGLAAF